MPEKVIPPLQVGSKVWYQRPGAYKPEWVETFIEAETPRSWTLLGTLLRLPKKNPYEARWRATPQYGAYDARVALSAEEVEAEKEQDRWVEASWCIAEKVRHCRDADVLRQVAQLINYSLEEPK